MNIMLKLFAFGMVAMPIITLYLTWNVYDRWYETGVWRSSDFPTYSNYFLDEDITEEVNAVKKWMLKEGFSTDSYSDEYIARKVVLGESVLFYDVGGDVDRFFVILGKNLTSYQRDDVSTFFAYFLVNYRKGKILDYGGDEKDHHFITDLLHPLVPIINFDVVPQYMFLPVYNLPKFNNSFGLSD